MNKSDLPSVRIHLYSEPKSTSVLSVEVWEVFRFADNPSKNPWICVGFERSTWLPFVAPMETASVSYCSADCVVDDDPVQVLGRLVFELVK